ncbi:DCC1-like thiol-disulfide oxidoreductase family protein [Paenibacillus sp. CC-CFT747]|nr:DCC1-like thiol-disulfide oxidoreductase family protein [Paenibacillus sp. CC-CFT747]
MNRWLVRLLDTRVPALPLALFRIGFSVVMIIEIEQMYRFRRLLFDPLPYMIESTIPSGPLLLIWLAAVLFLLAGYRTRLAAVVHYVMAVIVLGFGALPHGEDWQGDSLILTLSLLLLFMPSDRVLSVERLMERRRRAREKVKDPGPEDVRLIHTVFLYLTIGLMYLDSAFFKLSSSMYLSGLGVWAPSTLPINAYHNVSWLMSQEWLVRPLGYALLAFESLFLFLYPVRRLRLPLLAVGALFHLGVMFVFPIPVISLLVLALYLGLVPAGAYERLTRLWRARAVSLTVYYDRLCPLCRQTVAVLDALDLRGAVAWKPLQDHAAEEPQLAAIPEEELLHDIYAIDRQGRIHKGVDTYAAVLRTSGWLAPLGWLLGVWPVHPVAQRIYGAVAEKRAREGGCRDGVCSLARPGAPAADPAPHRGAGRLARPAAGVLLTAWLLSFVLIVPAGPLLRTYVTGDGALADRLENTAEYYKSRVYPWTGWTSHGVFMDEHFVNYRVQTMLVFEREGREPMRLPTIRPDGYTGSYNSGRLWELWTFETVKPELPLDQVERNLSRFVTYWAVRNNIPLEKGRILILQRPMDVTLDRFRQDRLADNLSQPWKEVGVITGSPGQLKVSFAGEPDNQSGVYGPRL